VSYAIILATAWQSFKPHVMRIHCRIKLAFVRWGLCWLGLCGGAALAGEWEIDFSRTNGVIRPLHGINGGPLCYRGTVDLSEGHRQLAIPLTRLHDCPWVNADVVDMHFVFPNPKADPAQPENYDFSRTDEYIQAVLDTGAKVVYRLGESIEHTKKQYFVHPPENPTRWAGACLGIIGHYNEGWGSGFHHNIQYWEIWNEPDVRPNMWTGGDEDYLKLYETAARAIKKRFPDVKVGGPAIGNTGDLIGDQLKPSPFLVEFLRRCRDRKLPLDFLSWHRYTCDPTDPARRARAIRRLLDEYGFSRTESHLNEWNYLPREDWTPLTKEGQGAAREACFLEMGGASGAAFCVQALLGLQDGFLDAANYYTGEIQGFGLFNFHGVPKKTFYAFKAFRQLLETPVRLEVKSDDPRQILWAGISRDGAHAAILTSNFNAPDGQLTVALRNIPWRGRVRYEVLIVDGDHNLEKTSAGDIEGQSALLHFELPASSVALIQMRPPK